MHPTRHATMAGIIGLLISGPAHAQTPAAIEAAWVDSDTDTSPDGRVNFHGPYAAVGRHMSFSPLPPHDFVRIEMDLLILRDWDGSVQYGPDGTVNPHGPDGFRLSVSGGPTLLSTTFSNIPLDVPKFLDEGKTQNYPSPIPGDLLLPQTGSAEHNSMGYHYPFPGPPQLVPMDATYHLVFLVPHHDADLMLHAEGLGLQSLLNESWGAANAKLTPLTAAEVPTPDDTAIGEAFAACLDASRTDQPEKLNVLVAGMDQTAAWVTQHVTPKPLDGAAVDAAIAAMAGDDHHITEREAAGKTLFDLGPAVEPLLRDARKKAAGEHRVRIDNVLRRLSVTKIDDDGLRQVALATRVLEVIGTPTALDARQKLVRGE